jgi:PIN domain nuclease of toxin-antitoxin system
MRYLLDTHSLIWFLAGDPQLSIRARQLIEDETNQLLVSAVSLWEMAIKFSIGKLNLVQPFDQLFPHQLESNNIDMLNITVEQLKVVCNLPFHHRDPFDRLLVAQSQVEKLPIISKDSTLDLYGIQREW